jgi:hypothetical protein
MGSGDDENERLRRAFERLPKDPSHGESVLLRHSDIRPEWVMRVIAEPHDRYEETRPGMERTTVFVWKSS